MKNRKAPRCMLGLVVVALFLTVTWSATTAHLSTITTSSPALEPGLIAPVTPATSTAGTILIDSAPNVTLEALQDPSRMSPLAKQAGNLDQARNGSVASPTDPISWVNGNAGASNSHYREGYSIPYRLVLTNLTIGAHVVDIEWDIKHSGKNAIDYITYYNRLNSPNHQAVFGHPAEGIDPTAGIAGLVLGAPFVIPAPPVSSTSGTVGGLAQPTTSFAALPGAEKNFTIYNGSINSLTFINNADGNLGDLTAAQSSTRLRINLNATNATVVLSWGGHIGSQADWGAGNSASAVSGSPYHTRFIALDGSGGNQDRSLSAAAVVVDCATCTVGTTTTAECGTQKVHTATIGSGGVCDNPAYSWSFVSNNSGATFATATNAASVTVNVGTGCASTNNAYTVRCTITCGGCTTGAVITCDQTVSVSDTTAPVIGSPGPNGQILCPNLPSFTPPTATDNCGNAQIIQVSDQTTPGACAGTYSRTVTWKARDACGNESGNVSQTITVVDGTAPTIGSPGADTTISCPSTPQFTPPGASDTCDPSPSVVQVGTDETTPGSCAGTYTIRRTWKARDCTGNESGPVSQTITVSDTTAPTIGTPGADHTIECPSTPDFTPPTASDTCDPSPSVVQVGDDNVVPGSCPGSRTVTRTWKARDCSGNESGTVSQTITVQDTTDPVLTGCPTETEITVDCLDDVPPPPEVTALDACEGSLEVDYQTSSSNENECGANCGGIITRTWTATDCSGNSAVCMQIITYGNPAPDLGPTAALLSAGNLVVGVPGTRSLTIPGGIKAGSSARCIVSKLGPSGPATALPDFGDAQLNTATCRTSEGVELRNPLLSQAISLALNLRLSANQENMRAQARSSGSVLTQQTGRPDAEFNLNTFRLTPTFWTQAALPGRDGLMGTVDDELNLSSARTQFVIPLSVLSALGREPTAADLLKFANAALAGLSTGDVSLSDLSAALDAVNRSFDLGRRRLMVGPSQR